MKTMTLSMVLILAAWGGVPGNDTTAIDTADEGTLHSRDFTIQEKEGRLLLSCTLDDGSPRELPCEDVVEIRLPPPRTGRSPLPSHPVLVELISGDRVRGGLGPAEESTITLVGGKAPRRIPFNKLRSLRTLPLAGEIPAADAGDQDVIIKKSDEQGKGFLLKAGSEGITYYSSLLDREILSPLDEVVAVLFTPLPDAPEVKRFDSLHAVVLMQDDSRLTGRLLSLDDKTLRFLDGFGDTLEIPRPSIREIHFKNGRVVHLSDLDPDSAVENANYVRGIEPGPGDIAFPWKRDKNAAGGPMVMKGIRHRKGIGVHARSAISWRLPPDTYRRFEATVGLDDHAGGKGAVVFRVFADDRNVFEKERVGTDDPVPLRLDVDGVKVLRLEVDFGRFANRCDYADWASARLIR